MSLLALDAASQCVGYAVLAGLEPAELLDGGLLTPSLARAVHAHEPAWLQTHLHQQALAAQCRVDSLIQEIEQLIAEHEPSLIIVETPSGLFGTGAKKGGRGSLTTYGMAAGRIYEACKRLRPGQVAPVTERQWTPGHGGKAMRQYKCEAIYPGRYSLKHDTKDGDLADAILLGRWWLERSPINLGAQT